MPHARTTSCIHASVLRMELDKYSAGGCFNNLARILLSWMHGDPCFSFHRSLPLMILSLLTKNKQNLNVRSFDYFAFSTHLRSMFSLNAGVHYLQVSFSKANLPEGMTSAAVGLNRPQCDRPICILHFTLIFADRNEADIALHDQCTLSPKQARWPSNHPEAKIFKFLIHYDIFRPPLPPNNVDMWWIGWIEKKPWHCFGGNRWRQSFWPGLYVTFAFRSRHT